jgi:hypothetical protein
MQVLNLGPSLEHRRDSRADAAFLPRPFLFVAALARPRVRGPAWSLTSDNPARDSKRLPSGYPGMWPKIRPDKGSTFITVTRYCVDAPGHDSR